jgi:hypothetical protein
MHDCLRGSRAAANQTTLRAGRCCSDRRRSQSCLYLRLHRIDRPSAIIAIVFRASVTWQPTKCTAA